MAINKNKLVERVKLKMIVDYKIGCDTLSWIEWKDWRNNINIYKKEGRQPGESVKEASKIIREKGNL